MTSPLRWKASRSASGEGKGWGSVIAGFREGVKAGSWFVGGGGGQCGSSFFWGGSRNLVFFFNDTFSAALAVWQVDGKMALYDKLFEAHPVAIGKAISKMERWARVRVGSG